MVIASKNSMSPRRFLSKPALTAASWKKTKSPVLLNKMYSLPLLEHRQLMLVALQEVVLQVIHHRQPNTIEVHLYNPVLFNETHLHTIHINNLLTALHHHCHTREVLVDFNNTQAPILLWQHLVLDTLNNHTRLQTNGLQAFNQDQILTFTSFNQLPVKEATINSTDIRKVRVVVTTRKHQLQIISNEVRIPHPSTIAITLKVHTNEQHRHSMRVTYNRLSMEYRLGQVTAHQHLLHKHDRNTFLQVKIPTVNNKPP